MTQLVIMFNFRGKLFAHLQFRKKKRKSRYKAHNMGLDKEKAARNYDEL